jgi:ABC-type multidrug transport system fused ATPase/permease subunit
MPNFSREDLIARYEVFDRFALDDQRKYYKQRKEEYRKASVQVNRFRAIFSALTGISAAGAVLVLTVGGFTGDGPCSQAAGAANETLNCATMQGIASFLAICSVILPAVASFFSMLADLFQWDRFADIYESAANNIERADAQLSEPELISDDTFFRAAYTAYVSGTLDVMASETSQWGQVSQTVPSIEAFIEAQRQKDERNRARYNPQGQPTPPASAPPPPSDDLPTSAG